MMDNECYSNLKEAMKKYDLDLQLDPRHMHRWNASERAIITCKNHFISGFSATYPDYPISKWYQLLSQSFIILNLLHKSRINPSLSEYA